MLTEIIQVPENILAEISGKHDINIRALEEFLKIRINTKGNEYTLVCDEEERMALSLQVINGLISMLKEGVELNTQDFESILTRFSEQGKFKPDYFSYYPVVKTYSGKNIGSKTIGQLKYVKSMESRRLVICDGPAGTGKTFLAVAYAIKMLQEEKVERIVLVRPAIEAGENLGFLPGTYMEKLDPYFKPIYDALLYILGAQKVEKFLAHKIIEVAPLAYMRGRTLDSSFIILDEAQNTTFSQLKMFLTRIGYESRTVITGDTSQIDLPHTVSSGLCSVRKILEGIEEVKFINLDFKDVVRDTLVQKIIVAYEKYERNQSGNRK